MQTEIERDPFEDFVSVAEVVGFVHRKEGETGVRELLAMFNGPVPEKPWLLPFDEWVKITTREQLSDAASELASLGLSKLAKIVREYADARPSEIDLSPYEPGTIDHRAWLAMMKRRKK